MYEAEVNTRTGSLHTVPPRVITQLSEYRDHVEARTLLPWGEHCTECAWPSCYATCDLYERRADGACRQFVDGVIRIPTPGAAVPYLQKITFRRWAKLWTLGTVDCHPLERADRWERVNIVAGTVAQAIPAPRRMQEKLLGKISYVRRRHFTESARKRGPKPDYFVIEIYNPNTYELGLTLSARSRADAKLSTFQKRIIAHPEFTRHKISFDEISNAVDTSAPFEIDLIPNDAQNVTIYFGLIDFVKERRPSGIASASAAGQKKCKCVVWDLDNTLWTGVLIEDGRDGLKLREDVAEFIKELDRRGILQSIASKNNFNDATAILQTFGLDEYFLHPQIHWGPKSQSVAAIATALNIGLETFFFIDDQDFEREEVRTALPQVTAIAPHKLESMLDTPAFQVPITEESRTRRAMYRQQAVREAAEATYKGDYLSFLKQTQMQVRIFRLNDSNLERVYELAQRTNQMNFSGNRYSLQDLRRIAGDVGLDTYVLHCSDRFVTYGMVGFAVVNSGEPRLMDLMFSCRVQGKRVEHGFLSWLLREYRECQPGDFMADYRKTPRNEASGAVFQELGFEGADCQEGVTTLRFKRSQSLPDEAVIEIIPEVLGT